MFEGTSSFDFWLLHKKVILYGITLLLTAITAFRGKKEIENPNSSAQDTNNFPKLEKLKSIFDSLPVLISSFCIKLEMAAK